MSSQPPKPASAQMSSLSNVTIKPPVLTAVEQQELNRETKSLNTYLRLIIAVLLVVVLVLITNNYLCDYDPEQDFKQKFGFGSSLRKAIGSAVSITNPQIGSIISGTQTVSINTGKK